MPQVAAGAARAGDDAPAERGSPTFWRCSRRRASSPSCWRACCPQPARSYIFDPPAALRDVRRRRRRHLASRAFRGAALGRHARDRSRHHRGSGDVSLLPCGARRHHRVGRLAHARWLAPVPRSRSTWLVVASDRAGRAGTISSTSSPASPSPRPPSALLAAWRGRPAAERSRRLAPTRR